MVWIKKKDIGDAKVSARLFDAEPGRFGPTGTGSAKIHHIVVEISSLVASQLIGQLGRFRLNLIVLAAVQSNT